jgi:hypothetical protein
VGTLKQFHAEFFFQYADLNTQGWLAEMNLLGSPAEVQQLGHGEKTA